MANYPTSGSQNYSYNQSGSYPMGQDPYSIPLANQTAQLPNPYDNIFANSKQAWGQFEGNSPTLGMANGYGPSNNAGWDTSQIIKSTAPIQVQGGIDLQKQKLDEAFQLQLQQAKTKEEIAAAYRGYQQQLGLQNNASANEMTQASRQQLLGYGWGGQ